MHCFQPTPHRIRSLGERHQQTQRRRKSQRAKRGNQGRERAGIPSCLAAQIISGSEACWESGSHSHSRLWFGQGYSSQNHDWIGPRLMVSIEQGQPGAFGSLKTYVFTAHFSMSASVTVSTLPSWPIHTASNSNEIKTSQSQGLSVCHGLGEA